MGWRGYCTLLGGECDGVGEGFASGIEGGDSILEGGAGCEPGIDEAAGLIACCAGWLVIAIDAIALDVANRRGR